MDRLDQHLTILGYLFISLGALMLLSALLVGVVFGSVGALSGDPEAARVFSAISGMVWMILLIISVPYFAAGYGLLKRMAWGRVLGLVMGALSLLSVPIGTAIGVYALWALTRPEAEEAFF